MVYPRLRFGLVGFGPSAQVFVARGGEGSGTPRGNPFLADVKSPAPGRGSARRRIAAEAGPHALRVGLTSVLGLAFPRAAHADRRGRQRLEALRADFPAALLAAAIRPVVDALQGGGDVSDELALVLQ